MNFYKYFLILIGIGIFVMNACTTSETNQADFKKYPFINPLIKDTIYYKEYMAEIQSRQNVEIKCRVSGYIDKIYVDEGQFVKANQLLFHISNLKFQQDLQSAEAKVASAPYYLRSL